MTRQAGFKRRVRARMAKTGESYATARGRLLAEHPGTTPDDSPSTGCPRRLTSATATPPTWRGPGSRGAWSTGATSCTGAGARGRAGRAAPNQGRLSHHYEGVERAEAMRQFTERDQALEANRDGEYVLWFEADLYDQLQIAEILACLAGLGARPTPGRPSCGPGRGRRGRTWETSPVSAGWTGWRSGRTRCSASTRPAAP